jgi:hypothetical protein
MSSWKHGQAPQGAGKPETKEYRAWRNMIRRCTEINNASYSYYGPRGISVCERWRNDFITFLADIGKAPSQQHWLDRINGDGNYEPGNVRWVTPAESARNRRGNYHTPKREEAVKKWREAGPRARRRELQP